MSIVISLFKDCFAATKATWKSKYKMLFLFYCLWLYRVEFMPADGGGVAKGIQVLATFAMLFLVCKYKSGAILKAYSVSFLPYSSLLWLYTYATITAVFSVMPQFAFFLAFQNVVIIVVVLWLFSIFKDFRTMERALLLFGTTQMIVESVISRFTEFHSFVAHFLGGGSMSAILISYTAGELMAKRVKDNARNKMLRAILYVSIFNIIISTSSGANASAIFGVGIGMIFSGHILFALVILMIALVLYFNQDWVDQIIFFIMPGKSREDIETATGRERIWEVILDLAKQKPWFGWGFGCVERVASDSGEIGFTVPDAHNNYIGFYGSLGYIGSAIAYLHFAAAWIKSFLKRQRVGYTGIVAAVSCAIMNGYSYAFLASKACSITIFYFLLIGAMLYYSRCKYYDIRDVK